MISPSCPVSARSTKLGCALTGGSFALTVLTNLHQMGAHRFTRGVWIVLFDGFENTFVVELTALWSAWCRKDTLALLTQEINDGINQDRNDIILSCLGEREVKIEVAFDEALGIVQCSIHRDNRFAHRGELLRGRVRCGKHGDLRFENFAYLNQVVRTMRSA